MNPTKLIEITQSKLVNNLDPTLWKQLVGVAKIKDMKVGILLNEIIYIFLEKQKIKEVLKNERTNRS